MTLVVVTAIIQTEYGVDRPALREMTAPPCGPGQVFVRVAAAGLSPGDRAMVTGVPYVNRLASGGVRRPKRPIPGCGYDLVVDTAGVTPLRDIRSALAPHGRLAIVGADQAVESPAAWDADCVRWRGRPW